MTVVAEILETGGLIAAVVTLTKALDLVLNKYGTKKSEPERPVPPLGPPLMPSAPSWYERLATVETRVTAMQERFPEIFDWLKRLDAKLDRLTPRKKDE
jgi:hypothetical protein